MQLIKEAKQIKTFESLIFPIEISNFKQNYWEKQEKVITRKDSDYYNSLLTIDDVDQVLDLARPNGSSIRVVKNQIPLSASKYENFDKSLNLNQIYASYADGYTVVINEIERFWQPLRFLCENIKVALNHKTVANMYLTPKKQKALAPHYDTHDVYVIQIHGKKHWKLYDSDYKTPILNSFQPIFQREQLKGERDITVSAGDMLYIPRGVPHEAYTSDESSLHLTIGIYPTQWLDLLTKVIYHQAHTNLNLRQSLPLGFLNKKAKGDELQDKIQTLMKTVLENVDKKGAMQFVEEDFRGINKPLGDGHFAQLDEMDSINCDTRLKHRDLLTSKVQHTGNISRIIFPGNVIKGPAHIAPCFSFISNNKDGFTIGDIPLINDENKIKLSKRLIRGGLLKIQD